MSVIEIVGGAILLVASLVIVFLTLMQHTHGLCFGYLFFGQYT